MKERTAVLLGATGLVGGHCLDLLLADARWSRVRAVGRRPSGVEHPKLEETIVDFERLERHADAFAADDVFCCLGTTIRSAGSQAAFRRVDYQYPLEAAQLAASRRATRFLVVTAAGADPGSRFFYNRVKGELEAALRRVGFASLVIARPSLLLGERDESRPGERFGEVVLRLAAPLLVGPLRRYRAIPARDVAAALVALAGGAAAGERVVESDELQRLAR